jgi:hypothetical protein
VRLCLLLALTLSPLFANLFGNISDHLVSGSVDVAGVHVALPGVRLALWAGGLLTVFSGLAARVLMRRVSKSTAVDGASA